MMLANFIETIVITLFAATFPLFRSYIFFRKGLKEKKLAEEYLRIIIESEESNAKDLLNEFQLRYKGENFEDVLEKAGVSFEISSDKIKYDSFIKSFSKNQEHLIKAFDELESIDKLNILFRIKKLVYKRQRKEKGDEKLEFSVLLGLVGSIASIISLIQQNNGTVNHRTVVREFRERENIPGSLEYKIGRIITQEQLDDQVEILVSITKTDQLFLDRINKRCLPPYYEAIDNLELDEIDVDEIRSISGVCVCRNIRLARKDNGGKFPSEEFKALWNQFDCT